MLDVSHFDGTLQKLLPEEKPLYRTFAFNSFPPLLHTRDPAQSISVLTCWDHMEHRSTCCRSGRLMVCEVQWFQGKNAPVAVAVEQNRSLMHLYISVCREDPSFADYVSCPLQR